MKSVTVPIRANMPPCSRCNISFVPFEGTEFWTRTPTRSVQACKRPGGLIRKQSILEELSGPQSANALRDIFSNQPPEVGGREANGKLTMRSLLILVAICFSATAFAQSAPPKVGNKSLAQVKPKEPMGCKLVGRVRGTKLWAGDCVGSELGLGNHDGTASLACASDRSNHARSERVKIRATAVSSHRPKL